MDVVVVEWYWTVWMWSLWSGIELRGCGRCGVVLNCVDVVVVEWYWIAWMWSLWSGIELRGCGRCIVVLNCMDVVVVEWYWIAWMWSLWSGIALCGCGHYRIVLDSDHPRQFSNRCNICKVAKVVHREQSENHCNQSDSWLSKLLPELYQQTPSSTPCLKHTHTFSHKSLCCIFLEPVRQTSSQYVRLIADFISHLGFSYLVK